MTGGRARHRGSLLRAAGLPVPVPLFTQAEREERVARRAAVIRERRAKRSDMVGLRALLLHLGVESQAVLAEVHGDEWRPHRWAHGSFRARRSWRRSRLLSSRCAPPRRLFRRIRSRGARLSSGSWVRRSPLSGACMPSSLRSRSPGSTASSPRCRRFGGGLRGFYGFFSVCAASGLCFRLTWRSGPCRGLSRGRPSGGGLVFGGLCFSPRRPFAWDHWQLGSVVCRLRCRRGSGRSTSRMSLPCGPAVAQRRWRGAFRQVHLSWWRLLRRDRFGGRVCPLRS